VEQREHDGEGQPTGLYLVGEGRRLAQLLRVKRAEMRKAPVRQLSSPAKRDSLRFSIFEIVRTGPHDRSVSRTAGSRSERYSAALIFGNYSPGCGSLPRRF